MIVVKFMRYLIALLIIFGSVLAAPLQTCAQAPNVNDADAAAIAIFGNVLSPFCPGRLLRDCPSSSAAELRESIRGKLQRGATSEEVLDELYLKYGDELRAAPEKRGFGMVAWLAPFVFLVSGAIVILLWLRSSKASATDVAAAGTLDPEMRKRIEAEMLD